MAKNIPFDSRVQNQLKDFIGARRWSVSRFATRYVEIYAEEYSRQEAPSTSTARKLIEDKAHVFTEKEITVLERMTNMPLLQQFLEHQHKELLAKSSGYASTSDNMEPEALLEWEIRRRSEKQSDMDRESIDTVLQRYMAVETTKPLIILTDPEKAVCVTRLIGDILDEAWDLSREELILFDEDLPPDTAICYDEDNEEGVAVIDGVELIRHAIKVMTSARAINRTHHIVLIFNTYSCYYETVLKEWQSAAYVFIYDPKPEVIEPYIEEPRKIEVADYREFCLSRMRTLPDMLREEVMQCDKLAACRDAKECARGIQRLYNSQRDWFNPDSYYYRPFQKLLSLGLPDRWWREDFTHEDREKVLTGLKEYYEWHINKKKEMKKAGISIEDDGWHKNGIRSVQEHLAWVVQGFRLKDDIEKWHEAYEMDYVEGLMED